NYENNEGKRVYVTEIVADNVRFLESNRDGGNGGGNSGGAAREESPFGGGNSNSGRGNNNSRNNQDPFSDDGKPIDISDDDLPF
ncbi:single-stranded DNA-binding protein, partial [Paenibacillus sp. 28ISP30-2]|nr:single-stranded DNA-binding protein [Paenibacillus sp. 28ISP30-2]